MTEREKMQSGELYNGRDRELVDARAAAKKLCMEFNSATYNDYLKKGRILDRLLSFKGENIWIEPDFFCDYGDNIFIGDNFYANHNFVILDCAEVNIGNNVYFGPNCSLFTACHPIDAEERNSGLEYAKPIKIGNDVWIGGNVCILPGVTIGDNVVIGAGSVVTSDIPSGVVAAGNPCKELRKITEADKLIKGGTQQ